MKSSTFFSLFYPPYFHSTHCKRDEVLDLDTQPSLKTSVGRESIFMAGIFCRPDCPISVSSTGFPP